MDQTGFFSNQGLEVDTVQNYTGFHTAADVYKLKAFRLINFKAFRDTGWILLNRLTLVLGENSSGTRRVVSITETDGVLGFESVNFSAICGVGICMKKRLKNIRSSSRS